MHEHSSIFSTVAHGVPWAAILQWIAKYGLSAVLTVLNALHGNLSGLSVLQIVVWVEAALAAVQGGQPLPPLPVAA